MSNPIRIKGVLYDSLSAACRAYGVMLQTVLLRVMLQTVLLRIKRGETVEQAFTGRDRRIGSLSLRKYGPFEIDGQIYNSLVDLAYAYGLDPCTVYRRYRTGLRGRDLVRPTRRKK